MTPDVMTLPLGVRRTEVAHAHRFDCYRPGRDYERAPAHPDARSAALSARRTDRYGDQCGEGIASEDPDPR